MDLALVARMDVGPAMAQVVVVGRDDDRLVGPPRLGTGEIAHHVGRLERFAVRTFRDLELLEPATLVATGSQADLLEPLRDVQGRRVATGATRRAAFELRRRQELHVGHEGLLREDRWQLGQGGRGLDREGRQRLGPCALGAQVQLEG